MALQLISVNPSQASLIWDLADFLDRLSLHKEAQEWFNRAIDVHRLSNDKPIPADYWQKLAASYMASRNLDEASIPSSHGAAASSAQARRAWRSSAAWPAFAGTPMAGDDPEPERVDLATDDDDAEAERFVRRQRHDALRALSLAPASVLRPHVAARPAAIMLAAALLIAPLAILPNGQDQAIAQARANRDEAQKQATRIDEIAKELGFQEEGGILAVEKIADHFGGKRVRDVVLV
jgi:tetratricopeptide (TPR) repeat protein